MGIKKELLKQLDSGSFEDIHWEFKNSRKCLNDNDKFNGDDFAKLIVAFSNREGGNIVIGINDDGTYEGNGIFEKFESNGKKGNDMLGQYFQQTVKDKISPSISITANYFKIEENELFLIEVPRRRSIPHAVVSGRDSGRIKGRVYYIRTNHGNELVDDEHLTWLFHNTTLPKFNVKCISEIITDFHFNPTYTNLIGIPEELQLAPNISNKITSVYLLLDPNKINALSNNERIRLMIELFFYSLITVLGERLGHYDTNTNSHVLPEVKFVNDSLIFDEYGNENIDIAIPISNFFKWQFRSSLKDHANIYYDSVNGTIQLKTSNPYYDLIINVAYKDQLFGLSNDNPYSWLSIKSAYEKDKSASSGSRLNDYITNLFEITVGATVKYPEKFDEDYYKELEYLQELSEEVLETWDRSRFYKNYPHHYKLYEIGNRIKNIESIIMNTTDNDCKFK